MSKTYEGAHFRVIILKKDPEKVYEFDGIRAEGIPAWTLKRDSDDRLDLGVHDVIEFRDGIMIDRKGDEFWCYRGISRPIKVQTNMSTLVLETP